MTTAKPQDPPTIAQIADTAAKLRRAHIDARGTNPDDDAVHRHLDIGRYAFTVLSTIDELTPLHDVTLGSIEDEAAQTLEALRHLRNFQRIVEEAMEDLQATLVPRARTLGVSWQAIGSALSMSGQNISKKAADKHWVTPAAED